MAYGIHMYKDANIYVTLYTRAKPNILTVFQYEYYITNVQYLILIDLLPNHKLCNFQYKKYNS